MKSLNCLLAALLAVAGLSGAAAAPMAPPVACTVIADLSTGSPILREGSCDQRFSPVSSFKLALAVMGYDSGILKGPHDPVWTLKPEFKASKREQAYKEVDPALWEKDSIVWFSQQLTTRLGEARFAGYVKAFDYGNMDVSGDPGRGNGLTHAWLMSSLRISPDEQVAFLHRLLTRELPVSDQAVELTRATIATYPAEGGWIVHGKSGSGWLEGDDGKPDRSKPQGWFIGWAEKGTRTVVFARFIAAAKASDIPGGTKARESLIKDLPALMNGR